MKSVLYYSEQSKYFHTRINSIPKLYSFLWTTVLEGVNAMYFHATTSLTFCIVWLSYSICLTMATWQVKFYRIVW